MWTICAALLVIACTPASESRGSPEATPPPVANREPIATTEPTPPPNPAPTVTPSTDRDELTQDAALFERMREALPVTSMATARAALDPDGTACTTVELGFDLREERCLLPAANSTCFISALTHHGVAFDFTASCRTVASRWSWLGPAFATIDATTLSRRGFVRDGEVSTYHQSEEARTRVADDALARELGRPLGADVPADLRDAFELLTDPRAELVVGRACGAGGSAPPGRAAARELVSAGRADLLRDALRGMNPAGRIYAYAGLRVLAANTTDDDAAFARAHGLDLTVPSCNGCQTTRSPIRTIDVALLEFPRR